MTNPASQLEMSPPSWLIEKYGLNQAYELYIHAIDRWRLITFNSDSNPHFVYKKQVDFLTALIFGDFKEYWWIGGNRCIAGDTLIYDPVLDLHRPVQEIQGHHHVIAWKGDHFGSALACPPFQKGLDDLFEVQLDSYDTIVCSSRHAFLTPHGWRQLSQLRPGSAVSRPPSIEDIGPEVRAQDEHHFHQQIRSDFQCDCPTCLRSDGEQLLLAARTVQDAFPSRDDAQEHIPYDDGGDGWLPRPRRSHPDLNIGPPPNLGALLQSEDPDARRQCQIAYRAWKRAATNSRILQQLLDGSSLAQSGQQAEPCANPKIGTDGALSVSHSTATIRKITPRGKGEIWDFTVPIWHNYLAAGFTNKNSGKTELGAVAATVMGTGLVPWCIGGSGFEDSTTPPEEKSIWIVSLDFPAGRDIILPKLNRYIPKSTLAGPFKVAQQKFEFLNGSEIGLKSADSGREKFQGVSRDLIWLDEEPPEDIYDECLARTIDCAGKILVTMTPLNGLSWSHDRIWKRQDEDPDLFVMHSTMEENPFLPRVEIQRFVSKMKDVNIRDARLRGLYTLIKGSHVFDIQAVSEMMDETTDPIRVDRDTGLRVWEEPKEGHTYIIGTDVGKGKAKGDWSVSVVGDPVEMRVVATMRKRIDAETYASNVEYLGRSYNNALQVVESNDHGIVVVNHLKRNAYPKIYRNKRVGRLGDPTTQELGYRTDAVGKPMLIGFIQPLIETRSWYIPDKSILEEFTTFIHYDDKIPTGVDRHKTVGRCGAIKGKHDDGLIALGLMLAGCYGVNQNPKTLTTDVVSDFVGLRSRKRRIGKPSVLSPVDLKPRRLQRTA